MMSLVPTYLAQKFSYSTLVIFWIQLGLYKSSTKEVPVNAMKYVQIMKNSLFG